MSGPVGGFGAPYRPPCGGWPSSPKRARGGCYQHKKKSEAALEAWTNATTVADYEIPSRGPIPPYSRINSDIGWPSCSRLGCTPASGQPLCGAWPDAEKPTCAPTDATHQTVQNNCYVKGTGVVDHSQCRKFGFKNVQARKYWHGSFAYDSHDRKAYYDMVTMVTSPDPTGCACAGVLGAGTDCSASGFEKEQPNPDTTKYLTEALSSTFTQEADSTYYTTGSTTVTYTQSVGRYTGLRSTTCSEDTTSPFYGSAKSNLRNWNSSDIEVEFVKAVCDTRPYAPNVTVTFTGSGYHVVAQNNVITGLDGSGNPIYSMETVMDLTWSPGSFVDQRAGTDNNGFYVWPGQYRQLTNSGPNCGESGWSKAWSGGHFSHTSWSTSGALSNPYTKADLQADVYAMLGKWDLANDAIYQWRNDDFVMIAPLVTYIENMAMAVDASTCITDTLDHAGELRGAPNPGGYGKHFDWDHQTWRACIDTTQIPSVTSPYLYAFGAWSGQSNAEDFTDLYMPFAATQWTPNYASTVPVAGQLPPGAFVLFSGGCAYAQKWAEIKIHRPSYNYFRPCETDRYLMDPDTVRCVQDGNDITGFAVSSVTSIATGDLCWICGCRMIPDGLYQVTKIDSLHYSATPKPFAPFYTFGGVKNCGTGMIGKLRYPNAWAIGGRVGVETAVQNGSNVDVTLSMPTYLATGDQVDFSGVPGLGTGMTVTVTDGQHIQVAGTVGPYAGGGFVKSTGAPDYQWYDSYSKGDYVYLAWEFNYRDYQERQRVVDQYTACGCAIAAPADSTLIRQYQSGHGMPQAVSAFTATDECLSFDPCAPQVMCISPNGEVWDNGTTYAFGNWTADERYGGQWQGLILQHVTDPLWKAPPKPCIENIDTGGNDFTNCGWVEDDGSCQADDCLDDSFGGGTRYYAREPYVEARATAPTGAPALPSGLYVGWLTLAELNTAGAVNGNVFPPPSAFGYVDVSASGDAPYDPVTPHTPWGIALREWECVCNGGPFADVYTDQEQKYNCVP